MFQYEHTNKWPLYWSLDPNVTFLNHGSFGACPLQVLTAQTQLREKLEREPVHFFIREFETLLDEARGKLAEFVGAKSDQLAFAPNATTGVNAVLRSLNFSPTDELLTTDQEYNACRNALNFVSDRTGAKVIVASLPFPIESPQQIVEAVIKHISPRTRLALLDHISSSTAFVFPIKQLVKELAKRGVDTLVDGAHAVGMLPLNLEEIGAAYYTGNCHKWLCAPKGAGFLYVCKDKQENIHPLTISHGANSTRIDKSRFHLEFDWVGTDDPTAYLCVPEAIKFMGSLLPGSWSELMEKNKSMALAARHLLQEKLGIKIYCCPDEMIGSMTVVKLPDERGDEVYSGFISPLQNDLWEKFRIEIPIVRWSNKRKRLLRISAQIYNSFSQYEYLAEALVKLL
ncbi:aminotransferase class V-fold PLP-dependent enzyme [Dapis sp. BLCC M229]|uniref:aminotransferase class V-fold PLP-dependent enzyme n=1 Tax=Dapis sp. BLCC M229 TaxID=3400188 RepID=UPI003CE67B52